MVIHELSVIYPIIQIADKVAKENNVEQITAVRLLVGEMHDMDEKWVTHYYKRFSKGTALEGSELQIRRVPMVFKCRAVTSRTIPTSALPALNLNAMLAD